MTAPIITLPHAAAYLLYNVPRGGRVHYQRASECLSAAHGRAIIVSQRPSGRPKLDAPDIELGVSLSYRDGALLVGYSSSHRVGVDLEPDDESLHAVQLARDHFAADEARAIAAEPSVAARRDLFLRLWVAKEAVLKATGRGVYDGLDQPDFARNFSQLTTAAPTEFAAAGRIPAGVVVTRALSQEDAPTLYIALAQLED